MPRYPNPPNTAAPPSPKARAKTAVEERLRTTLDNLAPRVERWIRAAARKDPARGAELFLRLAEHFVPKMGRTEPEKAKAKEVMIIFERGDGLREQRAALMAPIDVTPELPPPPNGARPPSKLEDLPRDALGRKRKAGWKPEDDEGGEDPTQH